MALDTGAITEASTKAKEVATINDLDLATIDKLEAYDFGPSGTTEINGGLILTDTLNADTIMANGVILAPNIIGGEISGSRIHGGTIDGAIIRASYIDYSEAIGLSFFPSDISGVDVVSYTAPYVTTDLSFTDNLGQTTNGVLPDSTVSIGGVITSLRNIFAVNIDPVSEEEELTSLTYLDGVTPKDCYKILWAGGANISAAAGSSWSASFETNGSAAKTFGDEYKQIFPYYGQFTVDNNIPLSQYPTYTQTNGGLVFKISVGYDPNPINKVTYIFSLLGYTYKVYMESNHDHPNRYLYRKVYGTDDSTYVSIGFSDIFVDGTNVMSLRYTTDGPYDLKHITGYLWNGVDVNLSDISTSLTYNGVINMFKHEYIYIYAGHYASSVAGYTWGINFVEKV